jgi:ribosomal protein S6--L-glutamate ligase
MKILILSGNKKKYSSRRFIEEAQAKGHTVECVDPVRCYMSLSDGKPMLHYLRKKLDDVDVVIPRIGGGSSSYGIAVVRQFEMMGINVLNTSKAISTARDKFQSLQLLSKMNLPLPKTSFANCSKQTDKIIKLVGGAPTIVKLLEGSQGKGIVLAETKSASESVIDAFRELHASFLVQEFIKDAGGADVRCMVLGDKVIATMKRQAKEGEFRSNIHRGGVGMEVKITAEERRIAVAAAKAMKLNLAGVDIIRSGKGPMIMEVNSSPGLEGIERATKDNIAGKIIDFCEEKFL